jgi:hypothetical protein
VNTFFTDDVSEKGKGREGSTVYTKLSIEKKSIDIYVLAHLMCCIVSLLVAKLSPPFFRYVICEEK